MIKGMVSCVIPTYKRTIELKRAIDSVLCQTYKSFEIIVVDDNEPNDDFSQCVQQIVADISDDRVRCVRMPQHKNGAAARNFGISQCKGEFLGFLDDDDEWIEEKLFKQVSFLNKNTGVDAVSCLYRIYKDGEIVRQAAPYDADGLLLKVLNRAVAICTPSVLMRLESLGDAIRFDESLKRHQDLQFFAEYLKTNKMAVLSEYLVRIHADSIVNKPTADSIVSVKDDFFMSLSDIMSTLTRGEKKEVLAAHYFEVVLVALREKRFGLAAKYLTRIGINPAAYAALIRRMRDRKAE